MIKIKTKYTKSMELKDALFQVMKSEPGDCLYKNRTPNIREIESQKQILYFHIKGNPRASFDCLLFKKEVIWENGHIKILFEDADGNEFFLGASYIKSYIRVPVWCRKHNIPDCLRGHEYDY